MDNAIMEQRQNLSLQDEISIIEIIRILWNKRWWILLATFITTGLAGIYAFTAKEQWTSQAEVSQPKLQDFEDYFITKREYSRILDKELNPEEISKGLFDKFNVLLSSVDEREIFFKQSDLYQVLIKDNQNKNFQSAVLSELAQDSIKITKPDPKKEPNLIGLRVSLSAKSPELAQESLEKFIEFINTQTYLQDINELRIQLRERINDLKYEKIKFEKENKAQETIRLANLQNALAIAQKAGITEHIKAIEGIEITNSANILSSDVKVPLSDSKLGEDSYLFMLGEKYLKAQIDSLKDNIVVYPQRYYQIQDLLSELEPLLEKTKNISAKTFNYQASPDYPVSKDKPKRIIILLLGLIIGFIISTAIIVIKVKHIRFNP